MAASTPPANLRATHRRSAGLESEPARSPAVVKSGGILALLASHPSRRFTLTEIAQHIGTAKSSTLTICTALQTANMVRRAPDGYQLGQALVGLGAAYLSSVDPVREFYDLCRRLPQSFLPTVQLSTLDGGMNTVFLARQDGSRALRLGLLSEIGRHVPAQCTASGKAILAELSAGELERRLSNLDEWPIFTGTTIRDRATLDAQLLTIRRQGHSLDDGEVIEGIYCFAQALRSSRGSDSLFALSMTIRKEWLRRKLATEILSTLRTLAAQLQTRI